MKRAKMLLTVGVFVILSPVLYAAVPKFINFQGILKDGSSNPVANGSYSVIFTIYDAFNGGTALWAETTSVTTSSGLFSILLGSLNPVPDLAFNSSNRWMGIKVGADPEMTPRQQLVSLGYAFRVNSVDSALGGNILTKVSIGPGHTNTGINAFVAGENNTATGNCSTVNGGLLNTAGSDYASIGGGQNNTVNGVNSVVDGGGGNTTGANGATVGGGFNNTASDFAATVSGGILNAATNIYATVGGGRFDTASQAGASVSGGFGNIAFDSATTVSGGSNNRARGRYSVVGGGGGANLADSNSAVGNWSVIGGGRGNIAGSEFDAVGGGERNAATGFRATVGGGIGNTASGTVATVPGGSDNQAAASYSFAAGYRAKALNDGAFVWVDRGGLIATDFVSTYPDQFLIRASGGVGIGTNRPQENLSVNGGMNIDQANSNNGTGAAGVAALRFGSDSGEAIASKRTSGGNQFGMDFYTNFVNRMTITNSGDVGVGTAAPGFKLDVAGSAHATSFPTSSDIRLKKNLEPLTNILEKIEQIRGVSFDWNETYEKPGRSSGHREIGVIAKDVEKVFPELVSKWGDEQYRGVDYGRMTAVLIEAVKELKAENKALRNRITALEKNRPQAKIEE